MNPNHQKQTVDLVIPVFNETGVVEQTHAHICAVIENLPYDFTFYYVDDGSEDGTPDAIKSLNDARVKLVSAEAAGMGLDSGETAATSLLGSTGIIHGSKTLLMQDRDGQIEEPYSLSAGLDYPGVGPLHAWLARSGRAKVYAATDEEALQAALLCTRLEGIIPALESAHALAVLDRLEAGSEEVVVLNLSGRGDKDMETYIEKLGL